VRHMAQRDVSTYRYIVGRLSFHTQVAQGMCMVNHFHRAANLISLASNSVS
jgi:hypothetical protein